MFLIVPVSHSSGEVRRYPYVTIGIMAINILVFAFTPFFKTDELNVAYKKLIEYYVQHPYLELPEDVEENIPTNIQRLLKYLESKPPSSSFKIRKEQEDLDEMIADYRNAREHDFFFKYGHVPSHGTLVSLFTSMFIHGGIWHLLFNMLYLWVAGFKLEDLWGFVVYPVLYILSGIFSGVTHAVMFPESNIPLIGASGAVAGLMGAFMIRCYKEKIQFLYFYFFFLLFGRGKFGCPAFIILPVWFAYQVVEAGASSSQAAGIAFYAHIGGFLFGACVALFFQLTGFQQKVLEPSVSEKSTLYDAGKISIGEQILDLKKMLAGDPQNPFLHEQLFEAYLQKGNKALARKQFEHTVAYCLDAQSDAEAVEFYTEHRHRFPEFRMDSKHLLLLANSFGRRKMHDESTELLAMAVERLKLEKSNKLAAVVLIRYGNNCLNELNRPNDAVDAYIRLKKEFAAFLTSDQKREIVANYKKAKIAARQSPGSRKSEGPSESIATSQPPQRNGEPSFQGRKCPKCGHLNTQTETENDECMNCGIIMWKFSPKKDPDAKEEEKGGAKPDSSANFSFSSKRWIAVSVACALLVIVAYNISDIRHYSHISIARYLADWVKATLSAGTIDPGISYLRHNLKDDLIDQAVSRQNAAPAAEEDLSPNQLVDRLVVVGKRKGDQAFVDFVEKHNLYSETNARGIPVLSIAVILDLEKAVEHVARYADLDQTDENGWTPLMLAVALQRNDIGDILLEFGVDMDLCNESGLSAIDISIISKNARFFDLLMDVGADIEGECGIPPIYAASCHGALEIVEKLLENGADPNVVMLDNTTPLDCAIINDHYRIELMLRKHGAEDL